MAYIRLENVCFKYSSQQKLIKNLSAGFEKGKFTAIMGANGSGKTTLGKLMMGILKPQKGNVFVNGRNISGMSLGQVGKLIGYLFQNPEIQIFAPTVLEELSFIFKIQNIPQEKIKRDIENVLGLLHLSDKIDSMTFNLSYGEKQRLAIAGVILNQPDYLILDEPTTGLDFARKRMLVSILKELLAKGIGISAISHDIKFLKNFSGDFIRIEKGEIIETSA